MMDKRLLLISNGSELLGANRDARVAGAVRDFLGAPVKSVLFIPFASVVRGYDEYAAGLRGVLAEVNCKVFSIHETKDPRAAVEEAEALVIGGGNTFHLLRALYEADIVERIRARVEAGVPFVGWSAGSNVACPTIRTTNDMPIVEPPTLKALGLVPFQINPHYTDATISGHMGETRDERLGEFVHANPGVYVVGLREGTMLRIERGHIRLLGPHPARIFIKGRAPFELGAQDSFQFLLNPV